MKVIFRVLLAASLVTAATGCESFLDINDNPNQATSVNADALLANALTVTAANYHGAATNYNSYSSFAVGQLAKSGTVSGFSEERTYNYTNTYYQNLFNATYDNLNDYNLIEQQAAAYPKQAAIAKIMKVYNFLLLVDQYGDIPYTNALKGIADITPSYDKQEDIYKDFIVQLKAVIGDIDAATEGETTVITLPEDVVFKGNMTRWKQFANSLRLRILLRESEAVDVKAEMALLEAEHDGFIDRDVQVQPGYAGNTGQQNPFYNRYGFAAGAVRTTSEYSFVVPTEYIVSQYVDNNDPRITQLYVKTKRDDKPAYVGADLGAANIPTFAAANPTIPGRFLIGGTFLRGANAPTVLMLLAEHLFSKAEAEHRGLLSGGEAAAKVDFDNGIKASFMHTFRPATTAPATVASATDATPGIPEYNQYIAANLANPLVNYDKAGGKELEVILTQKYIAENIVASTEAWDDFRRTGLPKFKVSLQAAGPVPNRLFYPLAETNTNAANLPTGVTQYTKLFWDVKD
ncbi:hypothetical protein PK28_14075 [Hymenobacter sp. DG25B]|uniref:SusD/RagB family nutrient-binding outer membrane lipoprotein n=1 Tax=Hymenobacter sp. DG25B TaxID=1385664 RepID=UPI000540F08D|nr:SusD/RagB family nutrient-binding outer membrane lipoprotein [Hymenobacter sp. DG25B]AIZ64518.1 hypothetical protein PK28_14075 [Hymenobacter sp. DG25B]